MSNQKKATLVIGFINAQKEDKVVSLVNADPNCLLPYDSTAGKRSAFKSAQKSTSSIRAFVREESIKLAIRENLHSFVLHMYRCGEKFSEVFSDGETTPVSYAESIGKTNFKRDVELLTSNGSAEELSRLSDFLNGESTKQQQGLDEEEVRHAARLDEIERGHHENMKSLLTTAASGVR